jgi:hypothetical protein
MVNIANCNKVLLSVKALLCFQLLWPCVAYSHNRIYAQPTISAAVYQQFQTLVSKHTLLSAPLAENTYCVLRLMDYRRQPSEHGYWAQLRLDEQQEILSLQVRMEIWNGATLLWQRTVAPRRSLKYLADEVKSTGQPILASYLSLETGLLHYPALSANEENRLRAELIVQAADLLEQDLLKHLNTLKTEKGQGDEEH